MDIVQHALGYQVADKNHGPYTTKVSKAEAHKDTTESRLFWKSWRTRKMSPGRTRELVGSFAACDPAGVKVP